MPGRRTILSGMAALAATAPALAWEPARPIQLIVGFAPGGGADLAARAIAEASSRFFPTPASSSTVPAPAAPSPRSRLPAWCRMG